MQLAMISTVTVLLQLLPAAALPYYSPTSSLLEYASEAEGQGKGKGGVTSRFAADRAYWAALGMKNKVGVTRYQDHELKRVKRIDGKFFWSDPANREGSSYQGAKDLTQGVSWGWHHPAGVYSTIPVGSPLIDDQMNIYIGADDAIRKFDISGVLVWSYAPRGQLAAAPSLCTPSARRQATSVQNQGDRDIEAQEELVRPDWVAGNESDDSPGSLMDFRVGDLVKVKPGRSYWVVGKELYRAGDQGMISGVTPDEQGKGGRAVITWTRNGHKSEVQLHSMRDHFSRVELNKLDTTLPGMLVGSTTSGYVFAIDLDSGDELWATCVAPGFCEWRQTSQNNAIAGVKGSLACKGGIVVAATDRCADRYCYRYRNQTNVLTPGNTMVRGLSAADGSSVWSYKTFQPMWNFFPQWGPGGSVMFQDWEGRVYSLDYLTGSLIYKVGGDIGTHTNAHAVYDPGHNVVVGLGTKHYTSGRCNPYPAPGILTSCWTWPGTRGFIRGYNATSGRKMWEVETPEPPASAAVGMLNSPENHTRLVVTMGHNCYLGSPTNIWGLDPNSGSIRWIEEGPTLWTNFCAGDKEGADIRRAMGGREKCSPNSWSIPVVDSTGDIYVGNQVGQLMRYGLPAGVPSYRVELLSTLTTGVAFQDAAIAFGPGVMAVSTCTSLIVFQTMAGFENATWSASHDDYSASHGIHGKQISHAISEESHGDISVTPKVDSGDIWTGDPPGDPRGDRYN